MKRNIKWRFRGVISDIEVMTALSDRDARGLRWDRLQIREIDTGMIDWLLEEVRQELWDKCIIKSMSDFQWQISKIIRTEL